MSSLQPTNAQQTCESLLLEGKRYNIEHHILPSENAVADRLLRRGIELRDAARLTFYIILSNMNQRLSDRRGVLDACHQIASDNCPKHAYGDYDFTALDPEALVELRRACGLLDHSRKSASSSFIRTLECYLRVTGQTLARPQFGTEEAARICEGYVGALYSNHFYSPAAIYRYLVVLRKVCTTPTEKAMPQTLFV